MPPIQELECIVDMAGHKHSQTSPVEKKRETPSLPKKQIVCAENRKALMNPSEFRDKLFQAHIRERKKQ